MKHVVNIDNGEIIYHLDSEKLAKGIASDYGWGMGGNVKLTKVSNKEAARQKREIDKKKKEANKK